MNSCGSSSNTGALWRGPASSAREALTRIPLPYDVHEHRMGEVPPIRLCAHHPAPIILADLLFRNKTCLGRIHFP